LIEKPGKKVYNFDFSSFPGVFLPIVGKETTMGLHKCNCMFVPPQVLENLAKVGIAEARLSIQQSILSRKKRAAKEINMQAFIGAKTKAKSKRKVYDCKNKWEQRVKLVRGEGKPATGDKDVDLVYKYAGNVRDYFNKVLKRNSIDNKGMDLILNVHFGEDYMNAFWDGDEMTFGDGDGEIFISFTQSLDRIFQPVRRAKRAFFRCFRQCHHPVRFKTGRRPGGLAGW
jgi:Zn-dependent metalloprotease